MGNERHREREGKSKECQKKKKASACDRISLMEESHGIW